MLKQLTQLVSSFVKSPIYVSPSGEKLDGYVVVITGASGNLGKGIAEALYKEGASLALISRNTNNLKDSLGWDPRRTLFLNADCTKEQDVNRAVDETLKKYGKIDACINCIGHFLYKSFRETSIEDYESVMDNNLRTTFIMAKAVIPVLRKNKDGLIINFGSKISHNTNITPHKVLYAAAKYAVEGFSFALNKELKPYGIRVVCLMPATVQTFVSLHPENYLSPYDVASIVLMIIKFKDIDFESIVFKSVKQNI